MLLLLSFAPYYLCAQNALPDSTGNNSFSYSKLYPYILPTALFTYGMIGVESDQLKLYNSEIREELQENIDKKLTIDDFSQYAPFLTVYALNAMGYQGQNSFKKRTCVLATAYAIMGATVLGLKTVTRVKRPDGSSRNSFPSGHTATAFMGAEFLYQEYKEQSVWYGVAGYVVAAGTGGFRMYNNRHWLTDVVAGAGVGMLSTKLAYLITNNYNYKPLCSIAPVYDTSHLGLSFMVKY